MIMKIKKTCMTLTLIVSFFYANLAHSVNDFSKHHGVVVTRPMAAFAVGSVEELYLKSSFLFKESNYLRS